MLINDNCLQNNMKGYNYRTSIRHLSKLGVLLLREPQQKRKIDGLFEPHF